MAINVGSDVSGRKLFIGGLPLTTTEHVLREFCSQFGEVEDAVVMISRMTGMSRGFGFVTFTTVEAAENLAADENCHQEIEGKTIEFKLAVTRDDMMAGKGNGKGVGFMSSPGCVEPNKLFVGGLTPNMTQDSLNEYFSQYGNVLEVSIMLDRATGQFRGFAFVVMSSEGEARSVLEDYNGHCIDGKWVEVKRCLGKGSAPPAKGKGKGFKGKGLVMTGKGKGMNSYQNFGYTAYMVPEMSVPSYNQYSSYGTAGVSQQSVYSKPAYSTPSAPIYAQDMSHTMAMYSTTHRPAPY